MIPYTAEKLLQAPLAKVSRLHRRCPIHARRGFPGDDSMEPAAMTGLPDKTISVRCMELGVDFDNPDVPFDAKALAALRWLAVYGEDGLASHLGGVAAPAEQRAVVEHWIRQNGVEYGRFLRGEKGAVENLDALAERRNRRCEAVLATRAARSEERSA